VKRNREVKTASSLINKGRTVLENEDLYWKREREKERERESH